MNGSTGRGRGALPARGTSAKKRCIVLRVTRRAFREFVTHFRQILGPRPPRTFSRNDERNDGHGKRVSFERAPTVSRAALRRERRPRLTLWRRNGDRCPTFPDATRRSCPVRVLARYRTERPRRGKCPFLVKSGESKFCKVDCCKSCRRNINENMTGSAGIEW